MSTANHVGRVVVPEHVEKRMVWAIHKGDDGIYRGRCNVGRRAERCRFDAKKRAWVFSSN